MGSSIRMPLPKRRASSTKKRTASSDIPPRSSRTRALKHVRSQSIYASHPLREQAVSGPLGVSVFFSTFSLNDLRVSTQEFSVFSTPTTWLPCAQYTQTRGGQITRPPLVPATLPLRFQIK